MWNNLRGHVISWFILQVLQYNAGEGKDGKGTWSLVKGKLKKARYYLAVAEANLGSVCFDIGKTIGRYS